MGFFFLYSVSNWEVGKEDQTYHMYKAIKLPIVLVVAMGLKK